MNYLKVCVVMEKPCDLPQHVCHGCTAPLSSSPHRQGNGRSCSIPIPRCSGWKLVLLSPHLSPLRIDQLCCTSHEMPKWHPGATLPLMYAGKWQILSQILSLRTLQPWTVHCHRQQLLARLSKYFSFVCFIFIFISFSPPCGPSRKPN